MKRFWPLIAVVAAMPASLAFAASDTDALVAQTASALASADYARSHCRHLKIDDTLIAQNAAEAGISVDDLRDTEWYDEQVDALAHVEQNSGREMVCMVMPQAHGGLARGIITER